MWVSFRCVDVSARLISSLACKGLFLLRVEGQGTNHSRGCSTVRGKQLACRTCATSHARSCPQSRTFLHYLAVLRSSRLPSHAAFGLTPILASNLAVDQALQRIISEFYDTSYVTYRDEDHNFDFQSDRQSTGRSRA